MKTIASEKTTPERGCSQRQTASPPKRPAIQPKIGDQMGMPVKTHTKKKKAVVQWITRAERRWRTISSPTTTFSRSRATATAGSACEGRIVEDALLTGPP